ncbi:hypothetical protein ISN75_05370 [Dyella marensis]|uniref:hypothetical protein n=1 Tax=Dyella marensis TaxID=500610 RepID=UPI001447E5F9|nr:hypothetical protein [Dyella sp. SG609]
MFKLERLTLDPSVGVPVPLQSEVAACANFGAREVTPIKAAMTSCFMTDRMDVEAL